MKGIGLLLLAGLLAYAATGFYVVAGNESAVVRRCGRVVRHAGGNVVLQGSGLHWDLPWPWSTVDRVNFNEVRVRSLGEIELPEDIDATSLLRAVNTSTESQFLTGDKNILLIQLSVQYRISEDGVSQYLFGFESPETQLEEIVISNLSDLVSRSGVDYVHPLGLPELQLLLTERTRDDVQSRRLGFELEAVTVDAVAPPARVKSFFLDVADARNDKEKYINAARAYAEQQEAAARAEAQRLIDGARIYERQVTEAARGAADSFGKIIAQLGKHPDLPYAQTRRLALQRRYVDTMEQILELVKSNVMLDGERNTELLLVE